MAQLSEADHFIMKSINSLARAYVGLFTTPGRVLTAVKMIYGGNAARRQLKLLADPDKLYDVIMKNRWQKSPVLRGLVRELGSIYYREEIDEPTLQPDVTSEETLQFGPGYQEDQQNFRLGGHVIKDLGVPLRYGYGR